MNDSSYNSKPLTVIAIVVFIYSVAGGSFNGSLSLLGATLIFSKPILIEYMAIFATTFLLWRHVVSTWPDLKKCRQEILEGTDIHRLNNHFENEVRSQHQKVDMEGALFGHVNDDIHDVKIKLSGAKKCSFTVLVSYFSDGETFWNEYPIRMIEHFRLNCFIQKQYAKSFLTTIFIKPQFWDVYYPIVLSVLALFFYVENFIKR